MVKTNIVKKEHGMFDDMAKAMNGVVESTAKMITGDACPEGVEPTSDEQVCPTGKNSMTCKVGTETKYYCK